jgi:hypothetical protein
MKDLPFNNETHLDTVDHPYFFICHVGDRLQNLQYGKNGKTN